MSTILIVDDEYLVADILGYALEDEGYQVVKAVNGRKGLEVLDREKPALIITDYMMPVMNGLEFAQAVRQEPEFAHLPIVLMSGAHSSLGRATPALFAAVFDKPFDLTRVAAKVAELIGPASSC
jgi:CheY-like chemotaxis protein